VPTLLPSLIYEQNHMHGIELRREGVGLRIGGWEDLDADTLGSGAGPRAGCQQSRRNHHAEVLGR